MKRKNLFRWSVVLMVLIALMMGAGTAFAQDGAADPAGRPGHNGHFALQQLHAHASIPVLPLAIGRLIHRSLSVGRWSRKDHV